MVFMFAQHILKITIIMIDVYDDIVIMIVLCAKALNHPIFPCFAALLSKESAGGSSAKTLLMLT